MIHPTRAGIGLVRLGDSDFVPANPEDDLRGKAAYDAQGQRIGGVEDLYIDRQEREVRLLEVGTGGFLGIGKKRFLVPVEAVVEVAEDRITIEPGRTEKVEGPAPFDTKVAPPRVDEPHEDYASPPYGNDQGPDDRLDATLRDIHRRTSGGHVGGYGPYGR
jgi:sporulation protein YlmC with PRC-barrel domain